MTPITKLAALAATGLTLTACDVAYPVTVIGEQGMTFRGSATNTFLEGGSFHATNGKSVCVGQYQQHNDVKSVSFPITCNNGLTGIGTAHFSDARNGSGYVTMSDGSRWQFIFGKGATRI